MNARRLSRPRRKGRLFWAIQRHRLERIARDEIPPETERERLFLWTLQIRGKANYAEFILPGLLFMAETELNRSVAADPAPIFSGTASPRP